MALLVVMHWLLYLVDVRAVPAYIAATAAACVLYLKLRMASADRPQNGWRHE